MPKPRIYKDDLLSIKPFRISKKYEEQYFLDFIEIFRSKPKVAKAFIEKNRVKKVDK